MDMVIVHSKKNKQTNKQKKTNKQKTKQAKNKPKMSLTKYYCQLAYI